MRSDNIVVLSGTQDLKSTDADQVMDVHSLKPDESIGWVEHTTLPRNWAKWKKNVQIWMVAFHCMGASFMAAGIIPAYEAMSEVYGVTIEANTYLTGAQVRNLTHLGSSHSM